MDEGFGRDTDRVPDLAYAVRLGKPAHVVGMLEEFHHFLGVKFGHFPHPCLCPCSSCSVGMKAAASAALLKGDSLRSLSTIGGSLLMT